MLNGMSRLGPVFVEKVLCLRFEGKLVAFMA